jgi:hypothetical protein
MGSRKDRSNLPSRAHYVATTMRDVFDETMVQIFGALHLRPLKPGSRPAFSEKIMVDFLTSPRWDDQVTGLSSISHDLYSRCMQTMPTRNRIETEPDLHRYLLDSPKNAPDRLHFAHWNFEFGFRAPMILALYAFRSNPGIQEKYGSPVRAVQALTANRKFIANVVEETADTGSQVLTDDFASFPRVPRRSGVNEQWRTNCGLAQDDPVVIADDELDCTLSPAFHHILDERRRQQNADPEIRDGVAWTAWKCPVAAPAPDRARAARELGEEALSGIGMGSLLDSLAIGQVMDTPDFGVRQPRSYAMEDMAGPQPPFEMNFEGLVR